MDSKVNRMKGLYCDRCGVVGDGYYYPTVCRCCGVRFGLCWHCLDYGNNLDYIRLGLCVACVRDNKIKELLGGE